MRYELVPTRTRSKSDTSWPRPAESVFFVVAKVRASKPRTNCYKKKNRVQIVYTPRYLRRILLRSIEREGSWNMSQQDRHRRSCGVVGVGCGDSIHIRILEPRACGARRAGLSRLRGQRPGSQILQI